MKDNAQLWNFLFFSLALENTKLKQYVNNWALVFRYPLTQFLFMSLRLLFEKQILVVRSYQLHAFLFRQKSTNQRNFGPELNFHGSSRADRIYYIFWIKKFCKSVSTFFLSTSPLYLFIR